MGEEEATVSAGATHTQSSAGAYLLCITQEANHSGQQAAEGEAGMGGVLRQGKQLGVEGKGRVLLGVPARGEGRSHAYQFGEQVAVMSAEFTGTPPG